MISMEETQDSLESLGPVKLVTVVLSFLLHSKRRNLLAEHGYAEAAATVSFRKQTVDSS